jgi:PAS domain S-box-containing protein
MSGYKSGQKLRLNQPLLGEFSSLRLIVWISLVFVSSISLINLIGWINNVDAFRGMGGKWEDMKLMTSFCFLITVIGLTIIFLNLNNIIFRRTLRAISALLCLISILTLSGYTYYYITGHNPGYFPALELLFSSEKRMALLSAISFLLLGYIILLLQLDSRKSSNLAHILVIPVFLICYFTIVSYILGVYEATALNNNAVALFSGINFFVTCGIILLIRPETWLMKLFMMHDIAGYISRILIVPVITLPIIIGVLRIKGENIGAISFGEGVVLETVAYTTALIILTGLTAFFVRRTDRKKEASDQALRESEKRYRDLAENIPDMIMRFDLNLRFIYGNQAVFNRTGLPFGAMMGKTVAEYGGSSGVWEIAAKKAISTGTSQHTEHTNTYQGVRITYDVVIVPEKDDTGEIKAVIMIARDVTKQKETERNLQRQTAKLEESERKFRELVKNAPTAIYEIDFRTQKLVSVNDAMCNFSGYSREELLSMNVKYLLTEESNLRFLERIKTGNEGRLPSDHVEYKIKHKNGGIIDAVLNMRFNTDNNGRVIGALVVGHDITERKKTQEALFKSEQRLKYHLENSPLAVVEWDRDFNIIQWSVEAESIFGLKKEEVIGKRIDALNLVYTDDIPIVEKTMERLTSGKEIKVISQNRNYNSNGNVIDCIWYNSVLLDEHGKMSSVMSLVENITLLKRFEKELIASNERYEELLANARSIIIKQDIHGRFTYLNEFALDFFGYQEKEILGKKAIETIVPAIESSGRNLGEMIESIYKDPDKYSVNINENIKKNGERIWIEWHNKALFGKNNQKTGHIAIGMDITVRKKAEEALKESEQKLWSVLNATQESIYMFDINGIIRMTNLTGVRRVKKTSYKEVVGHHFSEFMSPDLANSRQEKFDEVARTRKPLQFEDERSGLTFNHNFFPVFKDDKVSAIVTYSMDITKRKKAETDLKESEDRFRTIAESLPVLISIFSIKESKLLFINESTEKSFGYRKEEMLQKGFLDLFPDSSTPKDLGSELAKNGRIYNREIKVRKSDGSQFWIMTSIRTINYMNNPCYLTASIDITETKKAQDELIRLNRTLNAQSKSSQAMMHAKNERTFLNDVCKIITEDCGYVMVWIGYAQKDRQKTVRPMAYHGFDKAYIDLMNISWDNNEFGKGPTGTAVKTGKYVLCRDMKTDPSFAPWREEALKRGYASSLALPLILDDKPFGAVTIYSMETDAFSESEIALLSDLSNDLAYGISFMRLSESEKAAARAIRENEIKLKELIATKDKFFNIVAHDLKNPFTSLLGSSELLYDNINQMTTDNVRKLAFILNDAAKGGYAILQNLLDWSRSQTGLMKYNPEYVNLRSLIDENISNLQLQVIKKEINIKSDIQDNLRVWVDKNMLNTIVRNLLSNAIKYTYKNGTVEVSASRNASETTVSIKDSGIGISVEKAETIFQIDAALSLPGTEKEQGTGLGLKLCKEFTEQMGGRIWVESEVGSGSDFKFTIPVRK